MMKDCWMLLIDNGMNGKIIKRLHHKQRYLVNLYKLKVEVYTFQNLFSLRY